MSECQRCGKTFYDNDDSIHTCRPSIAWRQAMYEGYQKALDDIEYVIAERQYAGAFAIAFSAFYKKIDELRKDTN